MRAYLKLEAGPLALQAGRDVLALGPSVRAAEMASVLAGAWLFRGRDLAPA